MTLPPARPNPTTADNPVPQTPLRSLTIATRQSPLALWQAEWVRQQLLIHHPHLTIKLLPLKSQGDLLLETSLSKIGGKGLFIKELEQALLEGYADLAVHSLKDMPAHLPESFTLAAICQRGRVEDALVSREAIPFDHLPQAAVVGTSSLRRQSQLLNLRPDLDIRPVRGNLQTRLNKLETQAFDALVLASTGLERLGMSQLITQRFSINHCLPAIGQGAIGIECLQTHTDLIDCLRLLNHPLTALAVTAERAMNQALGGNCQSPIAGHAQWQLEAQPQLHLQARVASPCGTTLLKADACHSIAYSLEAAPAHTSRADPQAYQQASDLGQQVAAHLQQQGAQALLTQAHDARA